MRPQTKPQPKLMQSAGKNSAFSERWIPWLLIGFTFVAFARVLTHEFGPIDDFSTIAHNPKLNPPRFTREGVLWFWTHEHMGLYVPMTYTVWGLLAKATWVATPDEKAVFVDPRIFHAASLLAHLLSVSMVYLLLRRLLDRAWPAAAGAMLFALHPIQVEAVAWASGLKDVMYGAFSLMALWLYVRAASVPADPLLRHSGGGLGWGFFGPFTRAPTPALPRSAGGGGNLAPPSLYGWGMFWLLIALLCKPTAMVTPMLAAVLDYFILRRPLRKIARSILPWVLLVVPFAVVAKLVQPGSGIMSPPLWERPIVAGASLAFYLGKLLVPSNFTFGYDWVPLTMLQKNWFWAIAAVPLVLGALLWIYRWPKWLVAACAISVAALLPVLGFVPFLFQFYSTVADHYVYLAMLGPAMALAWGVAQVPARRWREAAVLCVTVALVLSGLTLWHLRFWHDEPALLYHILAVRPGSLLAHNGLGKFYQGHRNYVRAEEEYRKTVALNPEYLSARENLVNIYSYLGRADEAIEQIHALMAIHAKLPERYREDYTGAFFEVGQLTLSQGRYADAVRYLTESVRLRPEHAESRRLLQLAKEKFQAAATQAATKDAK